MAFPAPQMAKGVGPPLLLAPATHNILKNL
jgi:hypothetical protein